MAAASEQHRDPGSGEERPGYEDPGERMGRPESDMPPPYLPWRRGRGGKSVGLASVLSLMPGLGQVYVGHYNIGFLHVAIFASFIAILSSDAAGNFAAFFGVSLGFFVLYNIIDAGRRAAAYNLALQGRSGEELSAALARRGAGGSIFGGVVLIGMGMLLFMNIHYDVSMDWIEDWWPLGLVVFGIYLVVQGARGRSRAE